MLKVAELFSGIGAWSKALDKLKIEHEIVAAIEHDEKIIKLYNSIHSTNFTETDITTIKAEEFPNCDIIFYSPPCQAFSVAGKQKGFDDQRGVLFFDALRIIKEKKPKYAIMENVKNLTGKKFEYEFNAMLSELEATGYKNYWKILKATDYGIPQTRERVFIVSIRNDIDQNFEFPKPVSLTKNAKEFIKEDYKELTDEQVNSVNNSKFMSRRFYDSEANSPTLLARDYKDGGKYFIHNDKKVRTNSISHLRLMGFDDDDYLAFKKAGASESLIYHVAGNSIVVDVVEQILRQLLKNT